VTAREDERAQLLARPNRIATAGDRQQRLVGRAQAPVVDHENAATCHLAGEADPTCRHRQDGLAHRTCQIQAPVTRCPGCRRRSEGGDHRGLRMQRPLPLRPRCHGSPRRRRSDRSRRQTRAGQQQANGSTTQAAESESAPDDAHVHRLVASAHECGGQRSCCGRGAPAHDRPRSAARPAARLGRTGAAPVPWPQRLVHRVDFARSQPVRNGVASRRSLERSEGWGAHQ
jgi:hypothetical protein